MDTDNEGCCLVGPLVAGVYRYDAKRAVPFRGAGNVGELARITPCEASDYEDLLVSAVEGQREVAAIPAYQRAEWLRTAAELLEAEAESFARTITQQTGKVIRDTTREVERGGWTLRLSATAAESLTTTTPQADVIPGGERLTAHLHRMPIGVIAAITPFNAPLNLTLHKVGPALAAGNSVVVKPSPAAPLTAFMVAELMVRAGFPPAAIGVMPGGADVALALASDSRIDMVSFTGGVGAGRAVGAQAPLKRVTLELGANSPNIVHSDADLAHAVRECVVGGFRNSGQSCNSVQRILVHEDVADEFTVQLCAAVDRLVVGDPMNVATDIGPLVGVEAAQRVEAMIKDAVEHGATLLVGGTREGALIRPTVLKASQTKCVLDSEEVFAPVVYISTYSALEDAIARANASPYGLQASIFTNSLRAANVAIEGIVAGTVLVNKSSNFRLDQLPYGGVRASGIGREGPHFAVEEMTQLKLIVTAIP